MNYELLRNASATGAGAVIDLGDSPINQLQLSMAAYNGDAEVVVEWSYYDKTNGPWETLKQVTVVSDTHVTFTEFETIPGFLRYVRARVISVAGGVSVKLWSS